MFIGGKFVVQFKSYLFSGLLAASSLMVTVSAGSGGGSDDVVSSTTGLHSGTGSAGSC